VGKARCERADCDEPQKAHGLCQRHYDRERSSARGPRRREDRVLTTRARNRAVARLIMKHPEEFDRLYHECLTSVQAEDAELRRVAKQTGAEPTNDGQVLRLKRGPAAEDEEIVDRIDPAPPPCRDCTTYHQSGHYCLHCGALPSREIDDGSKFNTILVPADMTDERIKAAVERGNRRSKFYKDDDDYEEEEDDEITG
jgi:hypothetical protein